jgi:cytochrome c
MAAPFRRLIAFVAPLLAIAVAGCDAALPDHEPATGGNAKHGKKLIAEFGCGSCHTIKGVPGANATVAPSLEDVRKRVYLAGRLANTPENLQKWIRAPQSVDPKTAMPAVGVDEAGARDIAAYLYSR